jgi:F0F1-type ATP synthase assembly protein I
VSAIVAQMTARVEISRLAPIPVGRRRRPREESTQSGVETPRAARESTARLACEIFHKGLGLAAAGIGMGQRHQHSGLGEGTQYLAAAFRFAAGTIVFLFAGLGLDRWLSTAPLLTIAGALGGAALSFLSIYREFTADRDHPELKKWSEKRRRSE